MKLREFIDKLREYHKTHGNIEVETDQVEIINFEKAVFYKKKKNPFDTGE